MSLEPQNRTVFWIEHILILPDSVRVGLASFKEAGNTFSQIDKFGRGAWKLDTCPMYGGMLAVDDHGEVFTD